jgi:hypothetical protein
MASDDSQPPNRCDSTAALEEAVSDTDRLVAYAARTARELVARRAPQHCLTITTYRTEEHRSGFLGMRREARRGFGPDESEPFGWLLWSHASEKGTLWGSLPRRSAPPTHEWTISRGWWLVPSGAIDIIDHRSEWIRSASRTVHRVERSLPASAHELVDPDRPWRHYGKDDKRFLIYEHGWGPEPWITPSMPGRRLSAALTALRKNHGTYQLKRP